MKKPILRFIENRWLFLDITFIWRAKVSEERLRIKKSKKNKEKSFMKLQRKSLNIKNNLSNFITLN